MRAQSRPHAKAQRSEEKGFFGVKDAKDKKGKKDDIGFACFATLRLGAKLPNPLHRLWTPGEQLLEVALEHLPAARAAHDVLPVGNRLQDLEPLLSEISEAPQILVLEAQ